MAADDFSLFLRRKMRERNLSVTETAKRAGIARSALNKYLNNDIQDGKISTFVSLGHVLREHPLILISIFYHAQSYSIGNRNQLTERTKSHLPGDDIGFIADITYPDNSPVPRKSTFTKTWKLQNLGVIPWEGRFFVCIDEHLSVHSDKEGLRDMRQTGLRPLQEDIPVPYTSPGDSLEISVDFEAPSLPGTVISHWKMADEDGNFFFPDSLGVYCQVQVIAF